MRIVFELRPGEEIADALQRLATQMVSHSVLAPALESGANLIRNQAKQNAPYRTGTLRRSINTRVMSENNELVAKVGTEVIYAAQREFGGVIRPVRARALAIPLNNQATKYSPRDFPIPLKLRVVFTGRGTQRALLVSRSGKPYYVLARSVYQRGKPYFFPAFESKKDLVADEVIASIRMIISKMGK